MSVSTTTFGHKVWAAPPTDFPQFRGADRRDMYFDEQNLFVPDWTTVHIRATKFFQHLEKSQGSQKKGQSPLQTLLVHTLHLSSSETNDPLFAAINRAFFKESGYFSRFFSDETWEEWTENKTALGRVAAHLKDCTESNTPVERLAKRLDKQMLKRANEEAAALIKGPDYPTAASVRLFHTGSRGHCIFGLVGGIVGSLTTHHPLPLVMGLTQCFTGTSAQQKVGNEFQVNNFTNETESIPSVTGLSNGNFVVAWTSSGQGIARDTYGQIFHQNGSKIGNPFQLNTYATDDQMQPFVTHFNGNFIAAWTSNNQDGDRGGVFGQIFDRYGSKIGNEFQINTVTSDVQAGASIAHLDNSNFVITWHSHAQDGSGYGVFGQIFTDNGTKIGSAFRANTFTNGWQWIPAVLGLRRSHFVVTWAGMGPRDGDDIHGQLFASNGTKIGNAFEVNTNYQLQQSSSKERMARIKNNFVTIWHSEGQDGSDFGLFGQLFDENATKIGTEFQVNTFTNNSQTRPAVASFTNGNFVVVWHDETQDGDGWGVYGQLFDENATKLGNEFQLHTNTRNNQKNPSVATLRDGNFVVTWGIENQDRNLTAVFGQIFHDNITFPPTSSSTSSLSTSTSNPSSSSTKTSSFIASSSSTRIPLSSRRSTEISSTSTPSKRRLIWLWLLLGIGGTICLGGISYLLNKFRSRKRNDNVHATELGKRDQMDNYPTEEHYQRTPDHVRPENGRSSGQYGFLADASTFEGEYQLTPDHVGPGTGGQYGRVTEVSTYEGEYQLTPDHVTQLRV